jgi:acyl CoA:acetate/3-ketoacid CoA transferase beta subunit
VAVCTHVDKHGHSKIVPHCNLPLTAPACVDRVYTDMAVIDVTAHGMVLREIAEGLTLDEIIAATAVPLLIDEKDISVF